MTVKFRKLHNFSILFQQYPVDFINLLRRVALTQIPTFAIDQVLVCTNQSPLSDEMLAHRLAMIPFAVPLSKQKLFDCLEDKTEYEENVYNIEFKGNGRENQEFVTIRQLFQPHDHVTLGLSNNDDIMITPLDNGCSIWLKARLTLGTLKDHAKWQSCWAYLYHFDYKAELPDFMEDSELAALIQKAFDHYNNLVRNINGDDRNNTLKKLKYNKLDKYDQTLLFIESHSEYTEIEILKLSVFKFMQIPCL